MSMFKVGDRVVCTRDSWNKGIKGLNGTIVLVGEGWVSVEFDVNMRGHSATGFGRHGYCWNINESDLELLQPTAQKILITTDGKTTIARLYEDEKVVKRAEAKCAPGDEFRFETGANLAYDRLMDRLPATPPKPAEKPAQEPIKLYCVNVPGKWCTKGKVYKVNTDGCVMHDDGYREHNFLEFMKRGGKISYDSGPWSDYLVPLVKRPAKVGETAYVVDDNGGPVCAGSVWKVTGLDRGSLVVSENYRISENNYLVLDGYQPEPEYYSGKVVCVKSDCPWWTVGKVYPINDGEIKDDEGDVSDAIKSIEELNERLAGCDEARFIPLVE